jgi:hypothetical protein
VDRRADMLGLPEVRSNVLLRRQEKRTLSNFGGCVWKYTLLHHRNRKLFAQKMLIDSTYIDSGVVPFD